MRLYQTEGLTREALQEVYELVLTQKLVLEEKIERLKSEMAVAICAIEDGKIKSLDEIKTGLTNLFVYTETYLKLPDVLKEEEHAPLIRLDEQLTKDLCLEQIRKKIKEEKASGVMNTPPAKLHVVD